MKIDIAHASDFSMIYVGSLVSVQIFSSDGPGDEVSVGYQTSPNSTYIYTAHGFTLPSDYSSDADDEQLKELGLSAREWLYEKGFLKRRRPPVKGRVDSQRQKLYDAERTVSSWKSNQYQSLEEVDARIAEIMSTRWWTERASHVTQVTTRQHGKMNHYRAHIHRRGSGHFEITFPKGTSMMREMIVIHELAHAVTPWSVKQAHGWEFAKTYIDMVTRFISKEAGMELQNAFREGKVRFKPKRTRQMTEEQRQAAAERLVAARAAKAAKREMENA